MLTYYAQRPETVAYEEMPIGCMVYFRENIREEEPVEADEVWSADEYALAFKCGVEAARERVAANPEMWLTRAKT